MGNKVGRRRYELDWVRVMATIGVFLYHCSMFVNPFPWHVKNNELDTGLILAFSLFVGSWIMPVFFLVSGISASYAMGIRSGGEFIKERISRLFIPLLFGVLVLTPPQVYIERLANGQFSGSFITFYPHFFDGIYMDFGGPGNFAFFGLHLWFLLVLLLFSVITLPLFKRIPKRNPIVNRYMLFLLPALLFLSGSIQTQNLGGWDLIFYLLLYIFGYYYFSNDAIIALIRKYFKVHILIAVITSILHILWFISDYPEPGTLSVVLFYGLRVVNCWSLLLCILAGANKYVSFSNDFLRYGSTASMPFYILHQPIILIVGYLIKDVGWPIVVKLVLLVGVSFILVIGTYHFIIQKNKTLRLFFGMK